ncbi:hypothetical protein BC936DRAFT_142640 [Jimgerdemannia flammicorona]|uniref:DEUBAD domain-containing protein n=1 Tax=Jimgerdemannia flammicorona TaxID=994334 RepID=A0A433A094_9FUNG|nr:hypothetical protein BC936DRAFT_142640 [Jimgerdemannia flammicorona]
MDQDQFLQYLQTVGGLGGAVPMSAPPAGDGPTNQPPITTTALPQPPASSESEPSQAQGQGALSATQLSELRNILAGIRVPEINLANVLTPAAIGPLLNDPAICSGMLTNGIHIHRLIHSSLSPYPYNSIALFPYLPENSQRTPEELRDIVQSSQFQQALQSLSIALQSGQLGPLLTQLGLDPSAGNGMFLVSFYGGVHGVEAFLRAIEEQARRQGEEDQGGDRMDED